MNQKRGLARSQERRRTLGLRILARIIARHYLAHPELYPDPGPNGVVPAGNGATPVAGSIAHGEETRETQAILLPGQAEA